MRIVFVGAGNLAVNTARALREHGHEVIVIEKLKSRIDELSEELDCGFLHGDGSKPGVLRETNPSETDFLFCLTGNDQSNILASLVGRSLGFRRVITKVEDPDLEHICTELNLEDIIVPSRTIARYLTDMVSGRDILELSSMIKGDARFFSFIVHEENEGAASALDLPNGARVVCFYRDGVFMMAGGDPKLKVGDEAVVLTHSDHLPELRERFVPRTKGEEEIPEDIEDPTKQD